MDPTTGQDKVYTAEVISDTPFPTLPNATTVTSQGGTAMPSDITPSTAPIIPIQTFPAIKISDEMISSALNTKTQKIIQEFQFTPEGAIQVGEFEPGVSGDIRISPDGIVARNQQGDVTVAIDGDSGDAVFQGTIQGKNLLTGLVNVGNGNIQIDGTRERMIFFDSNAVPVIVIGNV